MVTPDDASANVTIAEATNCLSRAAQGDAKAAERLYELVYEDLRRVAAGMLRSERAAHTLQPTAVVHEAWLRLIDQDLAKLTSKTHFLKIAAQAMRRVLVDHARRRFVRIEGAQSEDCPDAVERSVRSDEVDLAWVIDLEEALVRLEAEDNRKAMVVHLHFFGGLTLDEVAAALEISTPTVDRDWKFARAWLKAQLDGGTTQ